MLNMVLYTKYEAMQDTLPILSNRFASLNGQTEKGPLSLSLIDHTDWNDFVNTVIASFLEYPHVQC